MWRIALTGQRADHVPALRALAVRKRRAIWTVAWPCSVTINHASGVGPVARAALSIGIVVGRACLGPWTSGSMKSFSLHGNFVTLPPGSTAIVMVFSGGALVIVNPVSPSLGQTKKHQSITK